MIFIQEYLFENVFKICSTTPQCVKKMLFGVINVIFGGYKVPGIKADVPSDLIALKYCTLL